MSDCNNSYVEVKGFKVWFEKFGSGPNIILLIPGPLGTGRTDFEELLDGEDELDFDKFTVIAVEAPGWGRSRPPLRHYGVNVYNNDCQCFYEVMKHLGYEKFSIIGYSEGAKTALLMAAEYPESVLCLVLSSLKIHSTNKGLNTLLANDMNKWKKDRIDSLMKVYGSKEEIHKLWSRYLKFAEFFNQYFPDDIFKNKYDLVHCPVLLTHGDKDPFIECEQPSDAIKRLPNAHLHRFPHGDHECHNRYHGEYKQIVEDHILNLYNYRLSCKTIITNRLMGWE